MRTLCIVLALTVTGFCQQASAAIGCTLTNPAEDLKYLYPQMTTYKEDLFEFPRMKGGADLFKALRDRLGSSLDPIYETYETPYTVYSVFQGQTKIGIVHGVNVPGKGGVIQVFLSADPKTGEIRSLFYQRLESPAARQLRNKDFLRQFEKMTLADFYKHDYYAATDPKNKADKVGLVQKPALDPNGQQDYDASLRGLRKNLVLLDFFIYDRKSEPFYERAQQAAKTKSGKE